MDADACAISCVIPVYNEAEVIVEVLRDVRAALALFTVEFELIVVDDGSTDGTSRLLDELASLEPRLRVVHLSENQGYGRALRAGFAEARMPLVLIMDGDGQFDPMEMEALLSRVGAAELVIGYRLSRYEGPVRHFVSRVFNAIVEACFALGVRDVNCAFKIIRRDTLSRMSLETSGYCVNAEVIALARAAGVRVAEVGVHHHRRRAGRSKVGWADVPRTLRQLLELRRRLESTGPTGPSSGRTRRSVR